MASATATASKADYEAVTVAQEEEEEVVEESHRRDDEEGEPEKSSFITGHGHDDDGDDGTGTVWGHGRQLFTDFSDTVVRQFKKGPSTSILPLFFLLFFIAAFFFIRRFDLVSLSFYLFIRFPFLHTLFFFHHHHHHHDHLLFSAI